MKRHFAANGNRNIIKLVDAQVKEDGSDHDSFLVMPVAEHGDLGSRSWPNGASKNTCIPQATSNGSSM
jgi:hypothetical protein